MKKNLAILFLLLSGTIFSQSIPYNVNKKKFPLGNEFRKLLPLKVGDWTRFAFHDFLPGEDGNVYYEKENKQIDMLFGKAVNPADMNIIWTKLYDTITDRKTGEVKLRGPNTGNTKFFLLEGKVFTYAWTRNLYYFCISTKDKADADDFMKSFPW